MPTSRATRATPGHPRPAPAAAALAADMSALASASGAATEADLIALGWPRARLQSLAPAARALLKAPRHG